MKVPRLIARVVLRLGGWKPLDAPPSIPKYVVIAQHTSNWDFVWMLAFASHFGMELSWVGKDALFRAPFGGILRALGGIPVDRSSHQDLVAQMAEQFRLRERLILVIAPEGTRHYVDYWKSGFHAIARAANVPIVPSRLDYERRVGGFGLVVPPTDDVGADMDRLREFYRDQRNKHPALTGRVRLKSEDASPS